MGRGKRRKVRKGGQVDEIKVQEIIVTENRVKLVQKKTKKSEKNHQCFFLAD
jgi:hypothetical protein